MPTSLPETCYAEIIIPGIVIPMRTERFFNTAGPVRADWHYLIPPLTRWDMDEILRLIAQGKYFVLHAPRQTGKTSCLLALSAKPVVLFLDEVDALVGDTLVSLLRQIRAGYPQRPQAFPLSIILCGVRDVRDYRIHTQNHEIITGGSAFNIKARSLRLGNFVEAEVCSLLLQHTEVTGQLFAPEALAYVWEQTQGQPWLVNALAYEACFELKAGRDRSQLITLEVMKQAREELIQRRDTHLDQLTDKLQEPRVHRVISALLNSNSTGQELPNDDVLYVADLGLITTRPAVRIANPIYQEIIPRELVWGTQVTISHETPWYLNADQRLNIPKLLRAFQQFFRENSEAWIERFEYKEAGPQCLRKRSQSVPVSGGEILPVISSFMRF